jgi:LuxR family maltose regulon positive regulatory protein
LTTTSLGQIQESENELHQAADTYRRSLQLFGDQGPPSASEEYIGLARIFYEWNDLGAAEQYGELSLQLARQYDRAIDRYVVCELLLARIRLARGDAAEVATMLAAEGSVRQNNCVQRAPSRRGPVLLCSQGNIA